MILNECADIFYPTIRSLGPGGKWKLINKIWICIKKIFILNEKGESIDTNQI